MLLRQAIHYKDHKAFCHWRTHGGGGRKHGLEEPGEEEEKGFFRGWTAEVLRRARELDDVAAAVGSTSALAPLYCLPVPAKDTLATRAFPSAAGSLHFDGRRAVRNAAVVERIEQMHGIIMGKVGRSSVNASTLHLLFTSCLTQMPVVCFHSRSYLWTQMSQPLRRAAYIAAWV